MLNDKKSTILLIDSDPTITEKLSERLSGVGFSVISATTADMAYRLFLVTKPDIILLDILMKDSNGVDMLTRIKPEAEAANIPIIVLSSETDVNTKVYGFLSGASDFIAKPYRFAEVLARVNTQLKIMNFQKELEQKNKELMERNALLQQLAITDALTGLYNRGYVLNKLHNDIAHSIRYKEPISFILADIDHFKRINDKFGHHGGDTVLKSVADIIKSSVREVDIVSRYGGEEFLIICPNTDGQGAVKVAERIRENISAQNFTYANKKINITISLGIKSNVFDTHITAEEAMYKLIEDADKAMYKAKANGRNRVEVFDAAQRTGHLKKNKRNLVLENAHHTDQANDKFLN